MMIKGHWCALCEPDPIPIILYHSRSRTGIVYGQWNEAKRKTESDLLWLAFPREPDTLMTQRNKHIEILSPDLVLKVV